MTSSPWRFQLLPALPRCAAGISPSPTAPASSSPIPTLTIRTSPSQLRRYQEVSLRPLLVVARRSYDHLRDALATQGLAPHKSLALDGGEEVADARESKEDGRRNKAGRSS